MELRTVFVLTYVNEHRAVKLLSIYRAAPIDSVLYQNVTGHTLCTEHQGLKLMADLIQCSVPEFETFLGLVSAPFVLCSAMLARKISEKI